MNDVIKNPGDVDVQKVLRDPDYKAAVVTPDTENGKKVAQSHIVSEQIQAITEWGMDENKWSEYSPVSFSIPLEETKGRMQQIIRDPNIHTPHTTDSAREFWDSVDETFEAIQREEALFHLRYIKESTKYIRWFLNDNAYISDLEMNTSMTNYSFKYFWFDYNIKLVWISTCEVNWKVIDIYNAEFYIQQDLLVHIIYKTLGEESEKTMIENDSLHFSIRDKDISCFTPKQLAQIDPLIDWKYEKISFIFSPRQVTIRVEHPNLGGELSRSVQEVIRALTS